jgi:hypothetical protein
VFLVAVIFGFLVPFFCGIFPGLRAKSSSLPKLDRHFAQKIITVEPIFFVGLILTVACFAIGIQCIPLLIKISSNELANKLRVLLWSTSLLFIALMAIFRQGKIGWISLVHPASGKSVGPSAYQKADPESLKFQKSEENA